MTDDTAAVPRITAMPLRPVFIMTILTGSFLLFLIQPMFARMILPLLGGSPSVWNVALLFYQAVLLLGYLYAHALQRFRLRTQIGVHLLLLGAAALTLPVAVATWFPAAGSTPPALWLLGLLAASIGPVFFVVSAQAPLMQAWFARSGDPDAANPFFLYAASNAGSLAALLAYPLLFEPRLRLATQAGLWAAGFAALALLVALAGKSVRRSGEVLAHAAAMPAPVTWWRRARWTGLALVPSGLLLSTTTHLTTDVMAMPLLWVIPLGLYLLSFIVAFSGIGAAATRYATALAPPLLILTGGLTVFPAGLGIGIDLAASLSMLFILALALHGQLAQDRPAGSQATDYYLWISVGGVLGGLFCALVAPLVFDWVYEQPILLLAAALLLRVRGPLPRLARAWDGPPLGLTLRYGLPAVTVVLAVVIGAAQHSVAPWHPFGVVAIMLAALFAVGHPRQFAWHLAALLLAQGGIGQLAVSAKPEARTRTFFGIYTVHDDPYARSLTNGTTLHGLESRRPEYRLRPTSYYAPGGGAGVAFAAIPRVFGDHARVAFVGLGSGTLSCYSQAGQAWTAFEIDPVMVRIARRQFGFLGGCRPDLRIVLGDARLSLAKVPAAAFDVLALDAFSSDAIPLHLITREAFTSYARVIGADGMLMVHISNRYLALEPVVAALAADGGWTARARDFAPSAAEAALGDTRSTWLVLTRTPSRMAALEAAGPATSWRPLRGEAAIGVWSDDFASVLPVIKALRGEPALTAAGAVPRP